MISRSLEPAPAAPGETRSPMPLEELDRWLRKPRACQPVAEGLSMLDGFIAAIVAGPATYEPLAWLCPLLGVTREAINDGTTEEYAGLAATAAHHNALSATLSETPERFAPIFARVRMAFLTLDHGAAASMPPSSSIRSSGASSCPPADWRIYG